MLSMHDETGFGWDGKFVRRRRRRRGGGGVGEKFEPPEAHRHRCTGLLGGTLSKGRCLKDVASKPLMLETLHASNSWARGP